MKLSPRKQLWWLNARSSRFVAVGFALGGLFHCLSILSHDLFTAIFGTAFAGAIGGGFMAKNTNPPGDAWVSAMGYGIGFLIGGCISVPLLFLRLEMGREINFSLPEFYVCFVLGFCIAGAASAAFTRSKLTSVANNTICFLTASGAGGLVVVVLFSSPIGERYSAVIGLFVTYAIGGVLSGAVMESPSGDDGEQKNHSVG